MEEINGVGIPGSFVDRMRGHYSDPVRPLNQIRIVDNFIIVIVVGERKSLCIYLTKTEWAKVHEQFSFSVHNSLSEYGRKKLLDKPICIKHRNRSVDDFVAEMILLRNELSGIARNFNEMLSQLQAFGEVPEILKWVIINEEFRERLFKKVDEIKDRINTFSERCLQESIAVKA